MTHIFTRKTLFALILGFITLGALIALPSVTLAQEETPDHVPPGHAVQRLERRYQQLQEVSVRGDRRLAKANQVIVRVQEWIEKLQGEGVDTGPLETALAEYRVAVARTQAYKDAGDAILLDHPGFDNEGHVTNAATAAETIQRVSESYRNGRQTLRPATQQLMQTIREFRQTQE
jgi:hypothetical protein